MASISEISCASCVSLLDRPVGFWDAPQWRQQVLRELYVWSLNRWSPLNGYTLQLANPGQMSLAGMTVHETRSVHVSADILDIRDAIATLMVSAMLLCLILDEFMYYVVRYRSTTVSRNFETSLPKVRDLAEYSMSIHVFVAESGTMRLYCRTWEELFT